MNVNIYGYFAAILTTAAFLPQLIKTLNDFFLHIDEILSLIIFSRSL